MSKAFRKNLTYTSIFSAFLFLFLFLNLVQAQEKIKIPFGEISRDLPIPLLGIILGLIDGTLNPCALSVLFFLVAYLLAIGKKGKTLQLGLLYAFTVFSVYFLFMYGVLNIIWFIGYIELIKTIVAMIVFVAGIIEIKDFFWYGKGIALKIPKSAKPKIKRLVTVASIPSTILLGILVSFVEIPCAGAFPFVYITILAEKVSGLTNLFYLFLYNFFFVLPLIVLTFVFYFGLLKVEKAEKTRKKTRKYMKLFTGTILILLGIAMIVGFI
jgi:cytochrome c biogenesis protein CcdA